MNYVLVENNTKSNTKLKALNESARIQKLWFIISLAITKIKLKQNSPSVEIMFSHVLSFRPFGFQARPWLNFPHTVTRPHPTTTSLVWRTFNSHTWKWIVKTQANYWRMCYSLGIHIFSRALLYANNNQITKIKEGHFRCNFFSEMNKIEVAFEKKKRKRKETVKTLGSTWESQKMFTYFTSMKISDLY